MRNFSSSRVKISAAWPFLLVGGLLIGSISGARHASSAQAPAPKKNSDLLIKTIKKYKKYKLVTMSIITKVHNQALEKDTSYQGKVFLSGNLFRLQNEVPDKNLVVFDGESLWNEQAGSKDFNTGPQVARAQITKANKSQMLLSSLLGGKDLVSSFSMKEEGTAGDETTFALTPKSPEPAIKNLKISIKGTGDKPIVSKISYLDDIGNKTVMSFSNVTFETALKDKQLFKYTPPKGAQVNSL